jgi:hypothetical protein
MARVRKRTHQFGVDPFETDRLLMYVRGMPLLRTLAAIFLCSFAFACAGPRARSDGANFEEVFTKDCKSQDLGPSGLELSCPDYEGNIRVGLSQGDVAAHRAREKEQLLDMAGDEIYVEELHDVIGGSTYPSLHWRNTEKSRRGTFEGVMVFIEKDNHITLATCSMRGAALRAEREKGRCLGFLNFARKLAMGNIRPTSHQ